MTRPDRQRFAWAKLNAYGILLALIALMAVADLINPAGSPLARILGEVPAGQHIWVTGFVVAGLCMLVGFARNDRIIETVGLAFLALSVAAQCVVVWRLLGWTDFTASRMFLLTAVVTCSWARVSVLWSKAGLIFTIPPRDKDHHR